MLQNALFKRLPEGCAQGRRLWRRLVALKAGLLTRSIFKRYSTPQSLHPEICANSLPPSSLGTLRPSRVVQPLVQKPATSSKIGPYKVATFALRPCPCSMTAHGTASATIDLREGSFGPEALCFLPSHTRRLPPRHLHVSPPITGTEATMDSGLPTRPLHTTSLRDRRARIVFRHAPKKDRPKYSDVSKRQTKNKNSQAPRASDS